MTKSTITRERLEQLADNNTICKVSWDERIELAQIALSAMDCEPVWAWHYREQWHVTNDERRAEFVAKDGDVAVLPLYRHAQPAQISEPVLPLQDKDLQGVIDSLEHPAGLTQQNRWFAMPWWSYRNAARLTESRWQKWFQFMATPKPLGSERLDRLSAFSKCHTGRSSIATRSGRLCLMK
ncbi:hypothetical protein J4730_21960 [Klebsiella pneumoniae]|uniref:Uncharacterized protein n=1 Tax=Klebsiella pneumoniae TaxID=573 RepID=A0A939NIX4_KLEPN|nr:hypothetical protein [Klebsiella pneumoniae]